jgi:molecular chaperone DnaK (HSP70)
MGVDITGNYHTITTIQSSKGFVPIIDTKQNTRLSNMLNISQEEVNIGEHNPTPQTIFSYTSLLGISSKSDEYYSILSKHPLAHTFSIDMNRGSVLVMVEPSTRRKDRSFHPEELVAFLLENAKKLASKQLGYEINEVVVSYPSYFNEIQRRALANAVGKCLSRYFSN